MTKKVLESDVYEVFERIRDPKVVYPDCELTPPFILFSPFFYGCLISPFVMYKYTLNPVFLAIRNQLNA
jgi:hypothetical protein